jgi:hypothetical protein
MYCGTFSSYSYRKKSIKVSAVNEWLQKNSYSSPIAPFDLTFPSAKQQPRQKNGSVIQYSRARAIRIHGPYNAASGIRL